MFRTFLLILFLCGLTVLSGYLEHRARAETYSCPSLPRVCVPDVKIPNCEVAPPLPRACKPMKSPQPLSIENVKTDKLNTVSRVSTLDILRAMSR